MSNDLCSPFSCNVCLMLKSHPEKDLNVLTTNKTFQYLLTCTGCHLIKYCSKLHQKLDWPIHKEFCQAVQKIKENFKLTHPFYISGEPKNRQDVEKAVVQIKYLLKNTLGRSLELQEEELSSFPVFCGQCFKMKSLKYVCTKCHCQVYCCEQHKELHKEKHEKVCILLQINYCPFKVQLAKGEVIAKFGTRINNLQEKNLYTFIKEMFHLQLPSNPCENIQAYNLFLWSTDFSFMLTIIWVMDILGYHKLAATKLNIFIVGASVEPVLWFRINHCKLFFLQNPQVKTLELDFIGPEVLEPNTKELKFTFLGCERLVKFNIFKSLFQDYCKSSKKIPGLIVAFNCGFSEFSQSCNLTTNISSLDTLEPLEADSEHINANDTWFQGLVEISQNFDIPIVFTSFTKLESAFDFAALQYAVKKQRLKVQIDHLFKAIQNPFRDLRPLRQWYYYNDDEEFYFRNGYVQAIRTRLEK